MNDHSFFGLAVTFILGCGAVFGWGLASWYGEADFRAAAIERGYAQYCAKSGDWAWKGECDGEEALK